MQGDQPTGKSHRITVKFFRSPVELVGDGDDGRVRGLRIVRNELGLCRLAPGLVTWEGWQLIDAHERAAGDSQGRPRVKLVRVPEMLAVAEPTEVAP